MFFCFRTASLGGNGLLNLPFIDVPKFFLGMLQVQDILQLTLL